MASHEDEPEDMMEDDSEPKLESDSEDHELESELETDESTTDQIIRMTTTLLATYNDEELAFAEQHLQQQQEYVNVVRMLQEHGEQEIESLADVLKGLQDLYQRHAAPDANNN